MTQTPGPDVVVDARGLRCPLPVVRLAAAVRDLDPGAVVAVRWTDPAARYDVPAWAGMRGHEVVQTLPEDDGTAHVTVVRLGRADDGG